MTEKRFYIAESNLTEGYCVFDRKKKYAFHPRPRKADCLNDAHILNKLHDENEQLKKDVDYWKQVASQYSNELNVFEHCKKYKTECKNIYWSSD